MFVVNYLFLRPTFLHEVNYDISIDEEGGGEKIQLKVDAKDNKRVCCCFFSGVSFAISKFSK